MPLVELMEKGKSSSEPSPVKDDPRLLYEEKGSECSVSESLSSEGDCREHEFIEPVVGI